MSEATPVAVEVTTNPSVAHDVVTGEKPAPRKDPRPTAAESLAKQRAADAAAKRVDPRKANAATPSKATTKKPAAKKPTTKKVPTVKTKTKPAPKATERKERTKKTGLRLFQVRALNVLADAQYEDGLPLEILSAKAKIGTAVMKRGLGAVDPACRDSHDEREGFKSLLTLGFVKVSEEEHQYKTDSPYLFAITARGREAIKKTLTAMDGKLPKVHPRPDAK